MHGRTLATLVALALATASAQASVRVKGHWDERGNWVPAHWTSADGAGAGTGPVRSRPSRVADSTFQLDVDAILRRPFRGEEPLSPPPGMAETWRDAILPDGPDGGRVGAGTAPNGGFGFLVSAINRVRRSRGGGALKPGLSTIDTGVVWSETATHRVKTKYEDGRVVGTWKFPKVSSS